VWSKTRGLVAQWTQPASSKALLTRLAPIAAGIDRLAYEAGPTGFGLARAVASAGIPVLVAATSLIPAAPGRQPKTDRIDCIRLAELAAAGLLKAVCIPSEQEQADRQIERLREQQACKARRVKQQIKSFLLCYGLEEPQGLKDWTRRAVRALRGITLGAELRFYLDRLLDELDFIGAQMALITARLAELAATDRHREQVKRLRKQPGVGPITAMTVRLELPQPTRFRYSGQVARFAGLAPGVHASGGTQRGGPILKSGNGRLRAVLVEAAWRAIRLDPELRKRFQRICLNTGSPKKAIVAVARHLLERLWRMLVAPQPAVV
jgi:transposase